MRQYHIDLNEGEVGEYVLLCGDPARSEKISSYFEKIEIERRHREYVTFTGFYEGIRITVMATGIGPDNTEIALVEILNITENPTFIRVGSSGTLREDIPLGALIISTSSVRLENTTSFFVPEGYPACADYEVIMSLIEACERLGNKYYVGMTATAPGFYGAQGRKVERFPSIDASLHEKLRKLDILNYEMEASVIFTLSSLTGCRSGAVCAVYANRPRNEFVNEVQMRDAERKCIETSLEAVKILKRMDDLKRKSRKDRWTPSMRLEL